MNGCNDGQRLQRRNGMELVLAAASRPERSELVSEEAQWLNTVMSHCTLQCYRGQPDYFITVIHRPDLIIWI